MSVIGSEFHVPGQNYVAQPGGHVGGGGGGVGVPGGRGPPSLGGIQTLGQSTPGIQPGGPQSGQQQPPQAQTPGVQQQQPQGPAPTTTPPVHTPSPQEMGKQVHLQAPSQHQQVYMSNPTRPVTQGYFQPAPRSQPSRNLGHRNNQGGAGTQVVGMPGGGGGGQPTALYQHQGIAVPQGTPMYDIRTLQQVSNLHPTGHQQQMYPPPSILSLFPAAQQRHQAHQGQPFYQSYTPHAIVQTPNMYPYAPGQGNPNPYFYQQPQPATPLNISRASANAVSGGAQHVGGPLAGAQGAGGVPQGALQQPTQPPQPIPSMAIPLAPTEVYTGHNGGTSSANLSSSRLSTGPRSHAIMDIRDPNTGDNIAADIYGNASSVSGASSNRETPQPQNPELVAEFAARVAKAASEESETSFASSSLGPSTSTSSTTIASATATSAAPVAATATSAPVPPSGVTNVVTENVPSATQITQVASTTSMKITSNPSKESPIQCNSGTSTTTTTAIMTPATTQSQNSTISASPLQQQISEGCTLPKTDSKPLQLPAQEFWPRGEAKQSNAGQQQQPIAAVIDEQKLNVASTNPIVLANKELVSSPQIDPVAPVASTIAQSSIELKEPAKSASKPPTAASIVSNTSSATPNIATNVTDVPLHSSNTATQVSLASANPNIPSAPPSAPAAATPNAAPVSVQPAQGGSSFLGPIPSRPPRFPFPGPSIDSSSFPTLVSPNTYSPPRRKNHNQQQAGQTNATATAPTSGAELPPSGKEPQKERKISDRSSSATSRGTTPTPSHNQAEQHQRSNGETALDKTDVATDNKADHHQKTADGKAMQKQKNKNKSKHKDLNRKGAEKEGTDMDAFVNPAAGSKPEGKTQQDNRSQAQAVPAQLSSKDENVIVDSCNVRESPKIVKDRENNETKIETSAEIDIGKGQKTKNVTKLEATRENVGATPSSLVTAQVLNTDEQQESTAQNNKETLVKETTPTIEESDNTTRGICDLPTKTNDIVDHTKVPVKDEIDVETIVAQKNEENAKVSALHATSNETTESETPVIEKQDEDEVPSENDVVSTAPKAPPRLKYPYDDNQWSPINVTGKREYGREFLMRLQNDPKSRVRPSNLPEMDVVLKECIKSRSTEFRPFKDSNAGRHDSLLPIFAKTGGYNAKPPVLTKKSYQGKSKPTKPNVIHLSLSLREDVKLRETENAWRPARLKPQALEEDAKTIALYKKVRSVLNKLTPQKFDTLVSQVRALEIDTQQKLQGVIDLVFEKAVDEPNFSVAYALMCSELRQMTVVSDGKKSEPSDDSQPSEQPAQQQAAGEVNFRKLIVERCQKQFQKNNDDEHARISKLKEIEECTDPEKKKDLQTTLEEYDRRLRVRSVGNIRFIGELFKKEMLTIKIMHFCINHLLSSPDEENLECLCKLLTTIGKALAERHIAVGNPEALDPYFTKLSNFVGKKGIQRKISSRIRFMIQDVMDLKTNNWIPRRDEAKPKTMDQIEKEAECERSEIQLNNTPMNTPRKDDRNSDRRRNRGGGGMEEGGWSQPVGKTRQQPYSVEAAKLSTKAVAPNELRLGNRNAYAWGAQSAAAVKTLTPNKYALLDSSMPGEMDKRTPLQVSGSRSTGPRDYGRPDYKSGWENKGSRLGSQHMNSSSSGRDTLMESGRSQSISMPPPSMKMKPQTTSIVTTSSSGSGFSSSRSNKPRKTEAELVRVVKSITDGAVCEPNIDVFIKTTLEQFQDLFDSSTTELFVRESINGVLERTAAVRQHFSELFAHMVNHNILPLSLIQTEFEKVLEVADDLVIDIPKIWTYFAELLSSMVVSNAHPLAEMKTTAAILKITGKGGKLMGELLAKLARDQGPKWTAEKWDQSGLQWSDITDTTLENIDDIIKQYKLEFLNGECKSSDVTSSGSQLTNEQIHDHLVKLMRDSDFDNICSWILANVGNRVTQPHFIRTLMTAILTVTVEERHKVWKLNENTFKNLQTLIKRFIDTDADLELQCLFAIQAYVHKLEHPPGLLFNILTSLQQNDVLSDDAFLTWESATGEFPGHAVAIKGLTSFFTGLREPDSDDA
ncbi:eukaryotic translation initiation factor 4 gamma 3-like isoform X4 [Venturia canescens]|uniref:eukaryotic translation initiation factor 4 gamma 3-like isoform X4 n=1 Tax=Venturia canescens TaxID=32260 RepID=UPI001C9BFB23|nr:eukaryotic translation initiation factor 4 gamma 3-like isoform X4 [Venturia canescens]